MTLDREQYLRDVLEPARRVGAAPADLFARYALGPSVLNDATAFDRHVEEIENYWRTLKQQAKYRKLADDLLGKHEALERSGDLDPAKLKQRQAEQVAQAQRRLSELIAGLESMSSCITPAKRDRLVEEMRGSLDAGAVREALRQKGLRVVDPCELPPGPPIAKLKYRELREHLGVRGLRFSAELVLGDRAGELRQGFRVLNGFRLSSGAPIALDDKQIENRQRKVEEERQSEQSNAANKALTILLLAERSKPGTLRDLLLWEVTEALQRTLAVSPSQRVVAAEAQGLGLDPGEADVLALSLVEAGVGTAVDPAVLTVEEALTAGELRTAHKLAAALRATDDDVRELLERLAQAERQVADLSAKAEAARAGGRGEDAAESLAAALRIAADDDDLRRRLAALPPPPVTDVRAGSEGNRVALAWRPSAARTGTIRYRVVREKGQPADSPGQGVTVGETDAEELTDGSPPAGEPLYYSVFATRGGTWSPVSSAGPVIVTPEVADLRLEADLQSVTGSWTVDGRASEVLVARQEGRPPRTPRDGQRVRLTGPEGFTDAAVRPGVTYYYRICVAYHTPGGRREVSPGLVLCATPERAPTPATDLRVDLLPDQDPPRMALSWTIPDSGSVSVRVGKARPPSAPGATATQAQLSAFGEQLGGAAERLPDGRARLTALAPHGRRFLTALTSNTSQTVVGNTVELAVGEPVRGLNAERLDEVVHLSWVWPAESTSVRVRWWATGDEAEARGETICLRRAYLDGGGLNVAVGSKAVTITVQALISQLGGEVAAAPVGIDVPALGTKVRYSIRWAGWGRRKRPTIKLWADVPCTLPALVVVRRGGSVMPRGPHQGEVVYRIPPQPLSPGTPNAVLLDVPAIRGPAWLVCFPEGAADPQITWVHPPVHELKVG